MKWDWKIYSVGHLIDYLQWCFIAYWPELAYAILVWLVYCFIKQKGFGVG